MPDPKNPEGDPTGTGSGKPAENANADTTPNGEGGGKPAAGSDPAMGAELRMEMKTLKRNNEALQAKLDERAEADKTQHQKEIDAATKKVSDESDGRFSRQELNFGVRSKLIELGVAGDAAKELADVVQNKYPDLAEEDVPEAVESTMKRLGIQVGTPVGKGTGGSPTGGAPVTNNPWSKDGWNRTKQWQITEEKGEAEAKKLAATVGSSLDATKPPE